MSITEFHTGMKLSDLLDYNPQLILILPRFHIGLGFGDKSVFDVCSRYNISPNLFIMICNIYTFKHYTPSYRDIIEIDGYALIKYLQQSHQYYLSARFTHIENHIRKIALQCGNFGTMLIDFFLSYRNEVAAHFMAEENLTFPYITSLLCKQRRGDYSIDKYAEEHECIEDKLNDLINIIVKYIPEEIVPEERISVWFDLQQVSTDLNKHAMIENSILVPFVRYIESREDEE